VLEEKAGASTAHVRYTVLLLPGGTLKVAGAELQPWVQSAKVLPDDVAALLKTVPYVKLAKGEKAAAAAPAADAVMN
jgi:hypothetical protein